MHSCTKHSTKMSGKETAITHSRLTANKSLDIRAVFEVSFFSIIWNTGKQPSCHAEVRPRCYRRTKCNGKNRSKRPGDFEWNGGIPKIAIDPSRRKMYEKKSR